MPAYKNKSPSKENWIGTTLGKSGFEFTFVILMENARVEIYIDVGDVDKNKQAFDTLYNRRDQLEEKFGGKLEWQRLDDRKACRIYYPITNYGLVHKEHWSEIHEAMIDSMSRLHKAFQR